MMLDEPWVLDSEDELTHLLEIFDSDCQISVLARPPAPDIQDYFARATPRMGEGFLVSLERGRSLSASMLPEERNRQSALADIDFLTTLFSDLLDCPAVGVRVEVTRRPMCPRFHVDRVGIRLLCSYVGAGTQWLDDRYADRSQLGIPSAALNQDAPGLVLSPAAHHQVPENAIALLKGSAWQGNELRGVIHRSPVQANPDAARVLLAVDALW